MACPCRKIGTCHVALWLLIAAAPGVSLAQETFGQDPCGCIGKLVQQEAAGNNDDARRGLAACMGHTRDPGKAA